MVCIWCRVGPAGYGHNMLRVLAERCRYFWSGCRRRTSQSAVNSQGLRYLSRGSTIELAGSQLDLSVVTWFDPMSHFCGFVVLGYPCTADKGTTAKERMHSAYVGSSPSQKLANMTSSVRGRTEQRNSKLPHTRCNTFR